MKKKATTANGKTSNRQPTLDFTFTSAIAEEHQANSDKSTSTMQAPRVSPLDESSSNGVNLPKGWQQQTLGVVCDIFAGFGFPERFQGKTTGDLPFYKVGDISETWKRGDVLLTRSNNYVTHDECRELRAKPLPVGTTVFAKIGAAIALNRRAMLTEPSLVDNNVMGLHPKSQNLNDRFLFHFACTLKLNELSRATTVPSIRKSDVEAIDIPIPPLPEQIRIVAEIEKQFTRQDAGVAALKRVHANLKRYRAAVLKAACEGTLVPTEASWKQIPLKELIGRISQGWSPKCDLTRDALPDEWAIVTTTAVQSMRYIDNQGKPLPASFTPRPQIEIKVGDFLMTRKGPRKRAGVACLVRATRSRLMVCDTVYRFRCNEDHVEPRYLELALNCPSVVEAIDREKAGINESGVSLTHGKLGGVLIPFPPRNEQTRIVAEVERRLSVVEELEALVSADLLRTLRLRQSILQKVFTGKL